MNFGVWFELPRKGLPADLEAYDQFRIDACYCLDAPEWVAAGSHICATLPDGYETRGSTYATRGERI